MQLPMNGASIHVEESGSPAGPPIIFLHGFPFSHRMWDAQVRALEPSYRVIAPDFRGHGKSSVGDGQYTIEGHVDDVVTLMDSLRISTTILAGLSMGGYVALRALERHPDRFRAAILADTRSEPDTNEAKIGRAVSMRKVKSGGSAPFAEEFIRKVFAPESFTAHPSEVGMIRGIISSTPPLSIAGTLLALAARTDTTASLAAIRIPTLILVGEHDIITPPAAATAMHERIPGSELHIIPAAAHMSPLENPAAFNEKMITFLGRLTM